MSLMQDTKKAVQLYSKTPFWMRVVEWYNPFGNSKKRNKIAAFLIALILLSIVENVIWGSFYLIIATAILLGIMAIGAIFHQIARITQINKIQNFLVSQGHPFVEFYSHGDIIRLIKKAEIQP